VTFCHMVWGNRGRGVTGKKTCCNDVENFWGKTENKKEKRSVNRTGGQGSQKRELKKKLGEKKSRLA